MKVCRKCGDSKPLDLFSRDRSRPDGRRNACKACDAIHDARPEHKARRAAYNRTEAGKAAFRKYRRTDNGSANSRARRERLKDDPEFRRRNVQAVLRYFATPNGAARLLANQRSPEMRAYRKRWNTENRDRVRRSMRASSQRRLARKRNLPASFTEAEWHHARDWFAWRCVYCGSEGPLLQEHFIPLSAGGPYTASNIVPACRTCNTRKRDKMPDVWCTPDVYARVQVYFDNLALAL